MILDKTQIAKLRKQCDGANNPVVNDLLDTIAAMGQDAVANAAMLARQTDLAREAEIQAATSVAGKTGEASAAFPGVECGIVGEYI